MRTPSEKDEALVFIREAGSPQRVEPQRVARSKKTKAKLRGRDEQLSAASVKLRDRQQNVRLKLRLANFAIIAVSAELILANAIFVYYLVHVDLDRVAPSILIAWLSSTVVEVIGIVIIIARNLFPGRPDVSDLKAR